MVGYWFDDQHLCGLEGGGFYLGQANQTLSVNSFGGTNLAVPVVLVNAAGPAGAIPIAGFTTAGGPRDVGAIKLTDQTTLYGGEFNWRSNCITCPNAFIDFIAGFRTLGLDDELNFATATSGVGLTNLLGRGMGGAPDLTERDTSDQFDTHNHFYGGQVGFIGEWRCGCWVFDLKAKIGLGDTQQMAQINGSTVDRVGGTLVTFPAGLLASSSNTGMFTRDQLSFVPEVGLTLGYQFTERLRFFVGYNFLYWSNVARSGDQINSTINLSQIPGLGAGSLPGAGTPAQPAFAFRNDNFWAQGITLGLEWRILSAGRRPVKPLPSVQPSQKEQVVLLAL